jgi:hypothetical protein
MKRSEAESLLRLLIGDQAKSLYSDTELRQILDRSNVRIHREIANTRPDVALSKVGYSYPAASEEISLDTDINSAAVGQIINAERVFWKAAEQTQYSVLPLSPVDELEELDAGSATSYDLLTIMPSLSPEPYYGVFRGHFSKLLIRPVPSRALTIRIYCNTDISETALSTGSDTTVLLNNDFHHLHDAVVFDAGFLLSFKDQSIREEFVAQRTQVMSLLEMQPVKERRSS